MLPTKGTLSRRVKRLSNFNQGSFLASETCYHQASERVACQWLLPCPVSDLAELIFCTKSNSSKLAEMEENRNISGMNQAQQLENQNNYI
jgi:hypothetical protein